VTSELDIAARWRKGAQDDELMLVVLYDKPKDCPNAVVLRAQYSGKNGVRPHALGMKLPTLASAYAFMNDHFPGLAHFPRDPTDEPQVVCCWL
jgi:hypothetical protein